MATLICYVTPVGDINIPEAGTEVSVNPQGVKYDWYPGKVVSRKMNDEGIVQGGVIQLNEPIITDTLETNGNFTAVIELHSYRVDGGAFGFGNGLIKFDQPISIDIVKYKIVENGAPMFIGAKQ